MNLHSDFETRDQELRNTEPPWWPLSRDGRRSKAPFKDNAQRHHHSGLEWPTGRRMSYRERQGDDPDMDAREDALRRAEVPSIPDPQEAAA